MRSVANATLAWCNLLFAFCWYDALCINQEDIPERNAQVEFMVWIYAKVEGTFIWLGEQGEASTRSFDLIVKFAKGKQRLGEEYWTKVHRHPWEFNDARFYEAMGLKPWSQEDCKALLNFYVRPWFNRQWILQEVIVPDRLVVFLRGSRNGLGSFYGYH
jgi:hypothetical protein